MKYLLLFTLILLFISSCTTAWEYWDYDCDDGVKVSNLQNVRFYVANNITYVSEVGDNWQLPEETLMLGHGDCEDFAILFMYLAYKYLELETYMVIYAIPVTQYIVYHAIVETNSIFYEPQTGMVYANYPYQKTNRYNYGRTMFLAACIK